MAALPEADPETRAFFLTWLETFSGFVRDVDYRSARPLWHEDVVIFGTHRDLLQGLETYIATQWDNVWPRTEDFRFDLPATRIFVSNDRSLATVIAPWTSIGFHPDGTRFARPGRATLVFQQAEGLWKAVHSHMSLNRGVPQTSHADRNAKSR